MNKGLKWVLWIVGGLILTFIVVVTIFVLTFDANKYKGEIAAAVNKATGRVLTIEGDIHVSIFPWLGAELGAMRLSNAPGFGDEPFAQIRSAAVRVKLLPLLRKDVEVDTVTVDGLHLLLRRDANGHTNWEDLVTNTKKGEQGANTGGGAAPALGTFALGGINLRDAGMVWEDRAAATRYEISKLNLHTGGVKLDQPVRIDSDFDLTSTQPALGAHVQLATEALYHVDNKQLALNGIQLTTRINDATLQDAEIKLAATALLDLAAEHYQVHGLNVTANLRGNKLPSKQINAALSSDIDVNLKSNRLTAKPLSLTVLGVKADGVLNGVELTTAPHFNGTLIVANFNVRDVMHALAVTVPASADPNTLKEANAHVQFAATTKDVALTELDVKLDQTTLRGDAAITNFSKPVVRFHLKVDEIDADRYLPPSAPKTAAAAPPAPPAATAVANATSTPLDTLRALDLDGSLAVGKLKISDLKLSDIDVQLNAKEGLVTVRPLAAKLYGGSYRGDLRLDARGKELQLATDDSLSNIAIGPLVQDYLHKDLIAGTGNITLQFTSTGANAADIGRGLNGKLGFSFANGRVNGVNLVEMIQKDYLKYIQGLGIDSARLNQTVFSKFAATATVTNGVIHTDDLLLNSAQLNVKGRGRANLVNDQIDLRLDALPTGQFAKQLGNFKDVVVPIKVQGMFTAPTYSVAIDEALKQKAKARLDTEKKKLEEKLQQRLDQQKQKTGQTLQEQQKKLEQQLQEKLKGLFK